MRTSTTANNIFREFQEEVVFVSWGFPVKTSCDPPIMVQNNRFNGIKIGVNELFYLPHPRINRDCQIR